MKKLLWGALVLTAMTGSALAGANTELKGATWDDGPANGSQVGKYSSAATGNGGTISGNGTTVLGPDQTTTPGSRAVEVHKYLPQSHADK